MNVVLVVVVGFAVVGQFEVVTANVQQCYQCDSLYCDDPFDTSLAVVRSCLDTFKNAKLYSSNVVASASSSASANILNGAQVTIDNTQDVDTIGTDALIRNQTHAEFFDIQRKIWEFFHQGEIDENTEFVCIKAHYYGENAQKKTYRGCVPSHTKSIQTACDFVNSKVGGSVSKNSLADCYTCNTNQCNSSLSLKHSLTLFFITILMKIIIM